MAKNIIRIGATVVVIGHEDIERTVEDIKGIWYYLEGDCLPYTSAKIRLQKTEQKELKRTPLKPCTTPIKKANKPINQVSEKRAKQLAEYRKRRLVFLEKNTECVVKTKHCTVVAEELHHPQGRENELLLDVEGCIPICHSCHIWITENSRQAIDLGFSKSRIS